MNRVSKFGRLVCGVIIFSPLVASCANNVDDKKEEVAAYEVVGGGLAVDSTENAEYGF